MSNKSDQMRLFFIYWKVLLAGNNMQTFYSIIIKFPLKYHNQYRNSEQADFMWWIM